MASPTLEWTDQLDAPVSGFHSFGQLAPGVQSAVATRRLWNDRAGAGGVDAAKNVLVLLQGRVQGSTGWELDGINLLESLAFTIRSSTIAGLSGGISIGTGVRIRLPDLAAGSYHEMEVFVTLPGGAPEVVVEFKLSVVEQRFVAVGDPWSTPRGIWRGVGRGSAETNAIIWRSAAFSASGEDTLTVPTLAYYHLGIPYQVLGDATSGQVTVDLNAKDAALTAGWKYGYTVVRDGSGVTVVKADRVNGTPVYPDDFDPDPAGSEVMAWGIRSFTGEGNLTVNELDGAAEAFMKATSPSGFSFDVARGVAITGGRKVDPSSSDGGTVAGNGTYLVQRAIDGSVGSTSDGSLLSPHALPIATMVFSGGVEDPSGYVDRRTYADAGEGVSFSWESPADQDEAYWLNSTRSTMWIRPDQVVARISAIAGASGRIEVELLVKAPGGSEVTLYTSKATDSRMPGFDFDDTSEVSHGRPERLDVRPEEQLIARVHLTGSFTSPAWLSLAIRIDAE